MHLTAADISVLSAASSSATVRCAGSLRRYVAAGRWLGLNNRYRLDPVGGIRADLDSGTLQSKHAGEYVAAAAPVHLVDGWCYLGQALRAHAAGHPAISRHLGYYAELRAAMALLATQGIGVFNQQHLVIDANGAAVSLTKRPTHEATWLYLEQWAQTSDAARVVGEIIQPERQPLEDWVLALPGQPTWAPLGTDWLLTLGLDLKRFAHDRVARNEASYRPTSLTGTDHLSAEDAATFVVEFVALLEPQGPGVFAQLDAHLLRISLETAFRAATNSTPKQAPKQFGHSVDEVVSLFIPDLEIRENLRLFLMRAVVPPDPLLIAEARMTAGASHPRHHLQVLCRAALLLRITTGAVVALLRSAGVVFASTSSWWWEPLGDAHGLWEPSGAPDDMADLWLDVMSGLDEIREWASGSSPLSYRSFLDSCAQPLNRATSLDALAFMGMAS